MTKLVKILLAQSFDVDDYYSQSIIRDSISDWEEVNDDDFNFLKSNMYRIIEIPHGFSPILLVKDHIDVKVRIAKVKELIAEERAKESAEKARKDKIKKDKEIAKRLKQADNEKALLEELKKKYEGPINAIDI